MTPIPIDDADDPRIAPYRAVRDRDLRERSEVGSGHGGRFIAEGEVVLDALLRRSRYRPDSLLIAEARLAGLAPLLQAAPEGVPVYTAGRGVMDAIVGFPIHRGVLGVGLRGAPPAVSDVLGGEGPVLVGIGIANHDNVGGLFRNAAAFGAASVLLDAASADPLYRKAIRVSAGAALSLPHARGEAHALIDALEAAGRGPFALTPRGDLALAQLAATPRCALVVGAEGPGLPDDILARLPGVRIAMAPEAVAAGFDSINVATAAAIALHHVMRNG
ncbi:MAG: RNA methyltransferase [Pseudomonadota bacterium]